MHAGHAAAFRIAGLGPVFLVPYRIPKRAQEIRANRDDGLGLFKLVAREGVDAVIEFSGLSERTVIDGVVLNVFQPGKAHSALERGAHYGIGQNDVATTFPQRGSNLCIYS